MTRLLSKSTSTGCEVFAEAAVGYELGRLALPGLSVASSVCVGVGSWVAELPVASGLFDFRGVKMTEMVCLLDARNKFSADDIS